MNEVLRIKEVLSSKGYTIKSLAEAMGLNHVSFGRTLSNNPQIKTLVKVAEFIDVPLVDFFVDPNAGKEEEEEEVIFHAVLIENTGAKYFTTREDLQKYLSL